MVLHTLNAIPGSNAFSDCLRLASAGDTIVLLGNGVYGLMPAENLERLNAVGADLFVLATDADAAGIACPPEVQKIDYDALVTLSERYPRQLGWF